MVASDSIYRVDIVWTLFQCLTTGRSLSVISKGNKTEHRLFNHKPMPDSTAISARNAGYCEQELYSLLFSDYIVGSGFC